MQLQESQENARDSTEHSVTADAARHDKTLVLQKDRVIFLKPKEFVTDVQTIQTNGLVPHWNTG
jgi:hypothetical protein